MLFADEMEDQGPPQPPAGAGAVMDQAAIQALVQQAVQAALAGFVPQLQQQQAAPPPPVNQPAPAFALVPGDGVGF